MPRLFTGLPVPANISFQLNLMRGGIPGARWIDPDNYHITLRFIGDVSTGIGDEIAGALDMVLLEPFSVKISGIDYFGGGKPSSIHARITLSDPLMRLQAAHERVCQAAGLAPEARKFIPHITLARLRGAPQSHVEDFITQYNLMPQSQFQTEEFVLYSARPGRGGGPYVREETYPLQDLVDAV